MLLLQGEGIANVNGYLAVPVFIDEITFGTTASSGAIRQSIPLPTSASGSQLACSLSGSQYAHEGFGAISANGQVFTVGECTSGIHSCK
jgi:hypothetical protein